MKAIRISHADRRSVGLMSLGLAIALTVVIMPGSLCSAEGQDAHHGDAHHPVGPDIGLLFGIINFASLVGLFVYIYNRSGKKYFADRRSDIETAMREAEGLMKRAEAKYQEYEQRLARLDDEVKELLADGKKEGEADKENILKQTDEFVEKISKQAKLISEQEVNLAKKALREETAELAVELATKILKKVMEQKDHDKLIEDYSSKLEEIH